MNGEMLAKLVCPATRTPLRFVAEDCIVVSDAAAVAYPVRSGIAILLTDEARPLDGKAAQEQG